MLCCPPNHQHEPLEPQTTKQQLLGGLPLSTGLVLSVGHAAFLVCPVRMLSLDQNNLGLYLIGPAQLPGPPPLHVLFAVSFCYELKSDIPHRTATPRLAGAMSFRHRRCHKYDRAGHRLTFVLLKTTERVADSERSRVLKPSVFMWDEGETGRMCLEQGAPLDPNKVRHSTMCVERACG